LANDTDLKADEGTGLKLGGPFSLEGRTLSVLGPGRIEIGGRFSMGGGVLAVAGTSPVVFRPNVEAALDGTLALKLPDEPVLQAGGRWKLIDGIQHAGGRFKEVALPKLPDGLSWDVASLYDDGTVAVRSRPDR
jgi:hypothetical protein